MKLCLDTNSYIFMKKGNAALVDLLEQADRIFIPAVVLGALHAGFLMGSNPAAKMKELESFLDMPGIDVTDINHEIARRYGEIVTALKKKR